VSGAGESDVWSVPCLYSCSVLGAQRIRITQRHDHKLKSTTLKSRDIEAAVIYSGVGISWDIHAPGKVGFTL
jgi:hypothetical protein